MLNSTNTHGNVFTNIPFNVIITLITAAMSIYIYMPNLPQMVIDLHTTDHMIRLSIIISIFTSCLVTFIIGPLSDALGRRRALLLAHGIYAVALLASAFVQSIESLLILRVVQGGASIVPMVLPFAILSDVYPDQQGQKYYAYCSTAITMSLIAAPLIGGFFGEFYNWRYAFIFLGTLSGLVTVSLYKFVPETLAVRKKYELGVSLLSYKKLLQHPRFMGIAVMSSILLSMQIAFFSVGTFYFIDELKMSTGHFSLYQGLMMLSNAVMTLVTVYFIKLWGRTVTLRLGMILMFCGIIAMLLVCSLIGAPKLTVIGSMVFYGAGLGLSWSLFVNDAMGIFPQQAGSVASALSIIRSLAMGIMMITVSIIYSDSMLPIALFFAVVMPVCWMIYVRLYSQPIPQRTTATLD